LGKKMLAQLGTNRRGGGTGNLWGCSERQGEEEDGLVTLVRQQRGNLEGSTQKRDNQQKAGPREGTESERRRKKK